MGVFGLFGTATWVFLVLLFGVIAFINFRLAMKATNDQRSQNLIVAIIASIGLVFTIISLLGLFFFRTEFKTTEPIDPAIDQMYDYFNSPLHFSPASPGYDLPPGTYQSPSYA